MLNRHTPPRDPKLHNDHAGDGDTALKQDDHLLDFLLKSFVQPIHIGQDTMPPQDPTDNLQKMFETWQNSKMAPMIRKEMPADYQPQYMHPVKDIQ